MKTRAFLLMTLALAVTQGPAQTVYTPYSWSNIAGTFVVDGNGGYSNGKNGAAQFSVPTGLAVDLRGNVYVADTCNHVIRKIKAVGTDWVVSLLAGSPGNPGAADSDSTGSGAQFAWPMGVAVDTFGNVFVADTYNNTIRNIPIASCLAFPWRACRL